MEHHERELRSRLGQLGGGRARTDVDMVVARGRERRRHRRVGASLASAAVLVVLAAVIAWPTTADRDVRTDDPVASTGDDDAVDGPEPTIAVLPSRSGIDEPVDIVIEGLAPDEEVTVRLWSIDAREGLFESEVIYTSDAQGRLDVATAEAVAGSYAGVDPMGLFTTMEPRDDDREYYFWGDDLNRFTLEVSQDDRRGSLEFRRGLQSSTSSAIRYLTLDDAGFVGTYYPTGPTSTLSGDGSGSELKPAVVALDSLLTSAALAEHDLVVLGLGLTRGPGLPDNNSEIPLEYIAGALRWLADQPGVDTSRISIMGTGRTSEAAMLTAIHFPELVTGGVVATMPFSVHFCSFPNCGTAAWSLNGKPLPFSRSLNSTEPADPGATLPVERLQVPLLAACGDANRRFDGCAHLDAIETRLTSSPIAQVSTLLTYPDAGYGITFPVPHQPAGMVHSNQGRSPRANELARIDLWPQLLEFLENQAP